ncbi:MAG: hypothetical protein U9R58_11725 [Chloroflexota bacterium]|nr:hypothetical protein [Chloroflexota bacterium]
MWIPKGGVVDEDGFAVEEAGFPGGLEGVGGDFDVGGMTTCGADTAGTDEAAVVGTAGGCRKSFAPLIGFANG